MPVGAKWVVPTIVPLQTQPFQLGVKQLMILVHVQNVRADIGLTEMIMETSSAQSPVHQTCTRTLLRNGVYHAIQNGTSVALTLHLLAVTIK